MKQIGALLLFSATLLCIISCHQLHAQSLSTLPPKISWQQLYYKNDLPQFETAVFSLDGERFLLSDDYTFISLWKYPFSSSLGNIHITDDVSITNLQFFGNDQDIFFIHRDGLAKIWDKDLAHKIFEYRFSDSAKEAAISTNARFIAADGELYDRQKKSLVGRAVAHGSYVAACFGGASLLLTAGYHDQGIAVRDIFSGNFEYRRVPYAVADAAISPNGKYIVAVTDDGRCYLWNWPDQEHKVLQIVREPSRFAGFSPDSKWFAVRGQESLHIFTTDPPERIGHLQPSPALTTVYVATDNLIAIGDQSGYVHIYDISSGTMIAQWKAIKHAIGSIRLIASKGYLWAGSSYYDLKKDDHGEVALYRINGLGPYIKPHGAVTKQ